MMAKLFILMMIIIILKYSKMRQIKFIKKMRIFSGLEGRMCCHESRKTCENNRRSSRVFR